MDLDNLLRASLELEQRIARDRQLRTYFMGLWCQAPSQKTTANAAEIVGSTITLRLPAEMQELLQLACSSTGKPAAKILEEAFAEYFQRNFVLPGEAAAD